MRSQYLGDYEGVPCYSAELAQDAKAPAGMSFQSLRQLFEALSQELFALAGRAKQIMEWDRDHQFCGRCGAPMVAQTEDRSKKCPACELTSRITSYNVCYTKLLRGGNRLGFIGHGSSTA